METALARVTATAVALPYEDRVELLSVLVKSIAKPVSHDSKKEDKNWSKMLDSYTGCMGGLWANEDPVEYQRRLREDRIIG
ncbi:hypothetical protein E4O00_13155 [Treponema sp. OMZ 788]|uniref:hypothetical protein n=1 Tax=unclassified Treponema TaxID=2638727 RepID=UPI0020A4A8C5|nr:MULTISPECIES: hypothetical protein [unclassified Treponema]UTC62355.1 hypothetical protein E4O05_00070 [Treponema sp. OMZ 787]UTC64673.1 hypothetical protein E4O00_13155 [Treponema sp. OMZ 788]UTC67081.1 hypothetical protein E4O06_14275 [Treponema sp. OMZ 789]UTC69812.1 hypothetical protein E4O01_14415 [Treponema sp. OMZ 790]UTC72526.1 hypothetical protein E4O02_14505 [Treponema sp. OMZ 791]